MADTASGNDTLSVYRVAATWLVGLSAAAVGGAFLNFDKVAAAPLAIRVIYFAAAVAFGISVAYGIEYFFWLNYAGNQREIRMQIDSVLASTTATDEEKERAKQERPGVLKQIDSAWKEIAKTHKRTRGAFNAGMVVAGVLLLAAAIWGEPTKTDSAATGIQNFLTGPSAPQPAAPYDIVQSAVHSTRHGKEAHTFLLDKKTGALWQMECKKGSDEVEFHRIHRYGLDGKPEDAQP